MADLPLVLAGPIVRRVEPRACSFWAALRGPAFVTARVYPGTQMASAVESGESALASSLPTPTRRFGQSLSIAVVTVELPQPKPPLTPGSVFSYDLEFTAPDFETRTLRTSGLLKDETTEDRIDGVRPEAPLHRALGYLPDRLPTFVTPPGNIGGLRLAHASCRKTTGPGFDATAWLDKRIGDGFDDPSKRIHQLFLTGDQIYGDEMSSTLLSMLVGLGADVVGGEKLAINKGKSDAPKLIDAELRNFQLFRRQKLVRELAGFTSIEAHDHLMSFREYAAMYLVAWSSRVWRKLADVDEVFATTRTSAHPSVQDHLSDWEACAKKKDKTYKALKEELVATYLERVKEYRDAVPYVARVLANCATYMICDDHEVTDDWNLNKKWQNRVYSKHLGRNIVRNGVMAYTLFQAWGNDPMAFESGKNRELLDETAKVFVGPGPFPAPGADAAKLDELTGCTASPDKTATFGYRVPGPRYEVVVLDTRTRRSFKGQGYHPPKLLGDSLENQIPEGPFTDGRELLIVVSPAPVLGPHLIDRIGQPLAQAFWDVKNAGATLFKDEVDPCQPEGRNPGVEQYDAEGWAADEVGFEDLLKRLAPYGRAVILSGDVHFSCSMVLDYWRKGVGDPSRLVQLTSSPARNEFKEVVEAVLRNSALLQSYQTEPRPERLAWAGKSSIILPPAVPLGPGLRARMNRAPALVPTRLWPPGTTIPADKPPDWLWRLSLCRDGRPESDLPTALRQQTLANELSPLQPLDAYRSIADRHAGAALNHFDHLRQMVFVPNVGVVDLDQDSTANITITHTLLSKEGPTLNTGAANTVHVIPLAPTKEARPELRTRA